MTPSTTSKELSERLKALGVKQDSHFIWDGNEMLHFTREDAPFLSGYIATFTAGELGEILPSTLKDRYFLHFAPPHTAGVWVVWYEDEDGEKMWLDKKSGKWHIINPSEAEARGLMLEYLLTNGLLQADAMV